MKILSSANNIKVQGPQRPYQALVARGIGVAKYASRVTDLATRLVAGVKLDAHPVGVRKRGHTIQPQTASLWTFSIHTSFGPFPASPWFLTALIVLLCNTPHGRGPLAPLLPQNRCRGHYPGPMTKGRKVQALHPGCHVDQGQYLIQARRLTRTLEAGSSNLAIWSPCLVL
jgi:hypothetical protein